MVVKPAPSAAPLPQVFRDGSLLRALLPYLETTAKLLKLLKGVSRLFPKCPLKSLNNQTDFDSAIRAPDRSGCSRHLKS